MAPDGKTYWIFATALLVLSVGVSVGVIIGKH
jgi:hypothetical protein